MKKHSILLITGGTGGHVIPAVNLGNYFIKQKKICYLLTDKRGYKYTKNFEGKVLLISSSHLGYNFRDKIKSIFILLIGFLQSLIIIIKIRPTLAISFGSYASFTPLFILTIFRLLGSTKIFLHEQNSVIGKVNSMFSIFADKIFLNFKETRKIKKQFFSKYYHVGLPFDFNIHYKEKNLDNDNKKLKKIFISGGSQGAVNLNYKMSKILLALDHDLDNNIEVVIQCPSSQKKQLKNILEKTNINYMLNDFYDDFDDILYEADLFISRAGAGALGDVIQAQTPTIFVPLPNSTNNHQFYNANYLAKNNASILIKEEDLENDKSYKIIKNILTDFTIKKNLIKNLQKIKNFDTNKLIFNELNFQ